MKFSRVAVLFILFCCSAIAHSAQMRIDASGVFSDATYRAFPNPFGFGNGVTAFTVSAVFDTDPSLADSVNNINPADVDYEYLGAPYFGSLSIGAITYTFENIRVGVGNNFEISNSDIPGLDDGEVFDILGFQSNSPGAILDGDGVLIEGIQFDFGFFTTDLDYITDSNFIPSAPPNNIDEAVLTLFDLTNNRLALGRIDSFEVTLIPLPPALWMMLTGLAGLVGIGFRKAA